ncbi:hypothetical protein PsYK624_044020 [Phanerochaete sordida]|uniref:Uncharacterized protein n=1 Tax=Phanerochaete sordida TaxID=48140 RepID=A0A9P3G5N0_9APHY|nr:hypothetical protein PsYK624_044020 [Phanerochaete sordida]
MDSSSDDGDDVDPSPLSRGLSSLKNPDDPFADMIVDEVDREFKSKDRLQSSGYARSELVGDVGRNLPLELVDLIGTFLRAVFEAPPIPMRHMRAFERRCLSSSARTCRQWQLHCRPLLFQTLILRNPQDIRFLEGVLTSTLSSWLGKHVQSLTITFEEQNWSINNCQAAWKALSLHLCGLEQINFQSSLPDANYTSFPLLARPCPRELATVTNLTLSNTQFSSFSALYRALAALQRLKNLQLNRVRWSEPCTALLPPSCTKPFPEIKRIHAEKCGECWPLAWMFASSRLRYTPGWRTPRGDEDVLTYAVRMNMRVIAEVTSLMETMRMADYITLSETECKARGPSRFTIFFGRRNPLVLGFAVSPPCASLTHRYGSLAQVVVLIDDGWQAVDWAAVEDILARSSSAIPVNVIPGRHFRPHEEDELQELMPGRRATLERVISDLDKVKMVKEFWDDA